MTLKRILAWEVPQNSAHCPRYSPIFSGVNHISLDLPGKESILPANRGIQILWITSADQVLTTTVRFTGTCNSLAVTMFSDGYLNSHHHWWPIASTWSAPARGGAAARKMPCQVGTAIKIKRMAGTRVQISSTTTFPCTCLGMSMSFCAPARYLIIATASNVATTMKIPTSIQVTII